LKKPLEHDEEGVWQVYGYAEAKAILRSNATEQAGFRAEMVVSDLLKNRPLLYQEGEAHKAQRTKIARFFTPKATSENYRQLMANLSDTMLAELTRKGHADLSNLSLRLAVRVAAGVIGLTDSTLPGLERRLEAFFNSELSELGWSPRKLLGYANTRLALLKFYFLDVRPAIRARRETPREDVISHLLEHNYNDGEILIECVTYGAAGMVTTREFICAAAWHMLEHPELRARYLAAEEPERHKILGEILRLEPVVGNLYRRATEDIELKSEGQPITIPAGDLIALHVYDANADESVVGSEPQAICPQRELPKGVQPQVLSFGDGQHRCPGSFIALQESDIFLTRLLALDNLRLERTPTLKRNALVAGYELRDFIVAAS
jgi:cytochrome P450